MTCGAESDNAQHSCVRPDGHPHACRCGCGYSWFPDEVETPIPRITGPIRISERDLQDEPAAIDLLRGTRGCECGDHP
jgi:hypothetical protein